eukprot:TRINITY_DN23793_c0_g2_i1.p1 TRINITY_DN23793_c0_g2~~TRINITY_DN23793_c0_g2_i1.p1  ORF type:complete len:1061 (-),score=275.77 TRINITY_DN23793_c0_g2_i1:392-3463(-)
MDTANQEGTSPSLEAATHGHAAVLKEVIQAGADVKKANETGWCPLHAAAKFGHTHCLEQLLAAEADVNQGNAEGWTAIHYAAANGHFGCMSVLLCSKADAAKMTNKGKTARMLAAEKGRNQICELLERSYGLSTPSQASLPSCFHLAGDQQSSLNALISDAISNTQSFQKLVLQPFGLEEDEARKEALRSAGVEATKSYKAPELDADAVASMEALLEERPLSNITNLLNELKAVWGKDKAFSDAVGGNELCQQLEAMISDYGSSCLAKEDGIIGTSINTYIRQVFQELTKDSSNAKVMMDSFTKEEEEHVAAMKILSEVLSADKPCPDRHMKVQERTKYAMSMLQTIEAQFQAVDQREPLAAKLAEGLAAFRRKHEEQYRQGQKEEEELKEKTYMTASKLQGIQSHCRAQEDELAQMQQEAQASSQSRREALCTAFRKIVEGWQEVHDLIDKQKQQQMKLEEHKFSLTSSDAILASEGEKLREQHARYERLAHRTSIGLRFMEDFASWMASAYRGMEHKTKQTLSLLQQTLPDAAAKHQVLADAVKSDLRSARSKLKAANAATYQKGSALENELQRLELSGADENELHKVNTEYEQCKAALKLQEKAFAELLQLEQGAQGASKFFKEKWLSTSLEDTMASAPNSCLQPSSFSSSSSSSSYSPVPFLPKSWLDMFFFTDERPRLPQPLHLSHVSLEDEEFEDGSQVEASSQPPTEASWAMVSFSGYIKGPKSSTALSAPAVTASQHCLWPDSEGSVYLVGADGCPVMLNSAQQVQDLPLKGGSFLTSFTEICPEQEYDLVTISLRSGSKFQLVADHPVPARSTMGHPMQITPSGNLAPGMLVLVHTEISKNEEWTIVTSFNREPRTSKVFHIQLDSSDKCAFLHHHCGEYLAIFGGPTESPLLRISRCRRAVDMVPQDHRLPSPQITQSDPGSRVSGAAKDGYVYVEPLPAAELVGLKVDPSVGSRGHPACSGFCMYFQEKRCKKGTACKKCHIPDCTYKPVREGQKKRKQRKAKAASSSGNLS